MGFSWVSAKYISMNMPLMELTFWRFIITALFAYITILIFGNSSIKVPKDSLIWLISGGVFMGLSQIANFSGLEIGYAGLGSIIFNATSPIFSFIIAMIFFGLNYNKFEVFALLLGSFGAMIIFQFWKLDINKIIDSGNLYFIFNSIGFAFVTLSSQKASQFSSAGSFTFYMSLIGALIVLPFCTISSLLLIFEKDYIFYLNLIFMAGVAGGFGTTAYFFAVSKIGSVKSSSFIFLVPLSSIIGSYLAFNEIIEIWSIIGGTVAILSVYIFNSKNGNSYIPVFNLTQNIFKKFYFLTVSLIN